MPSLDKRMGAIADTNPIHATRAAAIWSSADIVHIAIYRDMSKISRYVSRYIFMVIKVMKLMIIGDIKVFIAINFC